MKSRLAIHLLAASLARAIHVVKDAQHRLRAGASEARVLDNIDPLADHARR